jgi:hypothetical protein
LSERIAGQKSTVINEIIQKMSGDSNVAGRAFICPICGKNFDSNQTLEVHKDKDHGITPEQPAGVG